MKTIGRKYPFLCLFLLLLPAGVSAQKEVMELPVDLSVKNRPLHQVLDEISNQTGYFFTFDSRLIDSRKRISYFADSVALENVIDSILGIPSLEYRIIQNNIVLFASNPEPPLADTTEIWAKNRTYLLSGTIVDERSGKPLGFATVSLAGSYTGTISNHDGTFSLNVQDSVLNPIISVSYIGYSNAYKAVSIKERENITVPLSKNIISLQEVVIRYMDPGTIVRSSVERIPDNYLDVPAGMRAFYREKVIKGQTHMLYSEALVDIAKRPYDLRELEDKSKLVKGRKVVNISAEDTLVFKVRSGVNTMLQLDIAQNLPDFISDGFENRYDLRFSDMVHFQDRLAYVVSFEQKEFIQETLFKGKLYIDHTTLAILAADFEYDPSRIQGEQELFVSRKSRRLRVQPQSASYHVEYKLNNGRYHLSLVTGKLEFKVRKRRNWFASKYKLELEMAVTDVKPNNPPSISAPEKLRPGTIISDQVFTFDKEFWGDLNTIYPEISLSEALENMEESQLEITSPENP